MTTRERLLAYRDLQKSSPEEAVKFLEANREDERFVSLVKLGNSFLDGFRSRLKERVREARHSEELQRAFENEFIHGWAEVMEFASSTAKEAARRVLA